MIIQGVEISKGLIVDQPWIDLILDGQKCWEMRSHTTHFRGDFALIQKG
ncbi:ASCH domain-containing protein, partial [Vibrio anguillarum]|nr:ASCH domain-containing protein [Vibrio anguillarum]